MFDPSYPAFPALSFIAFVLVLIPLPWHFQAWNSGTCLFMVWSAIGCLNSFINSIIWRNDAIDRAPVWCDISTRLTLSLAVAIPASVLCINRRLYYIASCQAATITQAHKRRAVIIDLAIGVGLPILQLPLQFIVQGHRYNVIEQIGCYPTTFNTWAAYPLSYTWPNVLGLVSLIYGVLTLYEFMKRRAQFSQFLSANNSISANRYFRLMLLATIEILINTPMSAYGLYLNARNKIHPWVSWEDTHYDWYSIDAYPAVIWRSNRQTEVMVELNRWTIVFGCFIFFGFFGFAEEARKHYRILLWALAKRFGKFPPPASSPKATMHKRGPIIPLSFPKMSQLSSGMPPAYTPRPPPPPSSVPSDVVSMSDVTSLYLSPTIPDYKIDIDLEAIPSTPSTPSSSYTTNSTTHLSAHDDDEKYPITIPQAVAL